MKDTYHRIFKNKKMFDNLGYYKENDVLIIDNNFNPIHSDFFGVSNLSHEDYINKNTYLGTNYI